MTSGRGIEISGVCGDAKSIDCNGIYVPDESGGTHNGHPVFAHLRGHRSLYRNEYGRWMITDLRTDFPQNEGYPYGYAYTVTAGSPSPVGTSGGWKAFRRSIGVPCPEATAVAISGE